MLNALGGCDWPPVLSPKTSRLKEVPLWRRPGAAQLRQSGPRLDAFTRPCAVEEAIFSHRRDAGEQLATALVHYAGRTDVTVVGIAQGGVAVAAAVARQLQLPLTTWSVQKLQCRGVGSFGAIGEDGDMFIDERLFQTHRISATHLVEERRQRRGLVQARAAQYREAAISTDLEGRTLLVVDEGICSGATMRVALAGLLRTEPSAIVVAAPIAPLHIARSLEQEFDEVVTIERPSCVSDLGYYYIHLGEVTDREVVRLLLAHRGVVIPE